MNKTIPELIEEARTLGVNIYDHIAEGLWGTINVVTRHKAKQSKRRSTTCTTARRMC